MATLGGASPAIAQKPATQPSAESQPASRPAKRGYTAPGAAAQQVNVLGAAAASASLGYADRVGKDASEASVAAGQRAITGVSNLPSLGASQAITANAVVSQPGLRRGFPAAFGPAPAANLFVRTFNPLSGPNGAATALTRAGFSPAIIQQRLHK